MSVVACGLWLKSEYSVLSSRDASILVSKVSYIMQHYGSHLQFYMRAMKWNSSTVFPTTRNLLAYATGQWIFFRRLYRFHQYKIKDGSNLHINFICNLQNQKDRIKVSCQLPTFTFQVKVAGILNFLFQPPVELLSMSKNTELPM